MQVNICHRLVKQMVEKGLILIGNYLPKGLYATQEYKEGEIIKKLEGQLVLKPTRESIYIGNGMHVIDEHGKYMNHSFEPNVRIELNNVIAIRDIQKYEEITFNYNETEINMAFPFDVDGVKVCGKTI